MFLESGADRLRSWVTDEAVTYLPATTSSNATLTETHKLHICREGHPTVAEMLRFRNHLRRDPSDRVRYEELKLKLERENTEGIREYLSEKQPFIRSVLARLD
jgi:GrpB-like predicted nucleotidyltransferase (UPF0157 family)